MNYLRIKLGLLSLFMMATMSIFLTSCEQESINNGIDNVTNPVLDEQFRSYEIVEINNGEVWNTVENQVDGEVNLEMRKASSDAVLADWSFNMNRIQVQADDFTMNLVGEGGQVTQVQMPKTHVLSGQFKEGAGEIFMGVTKENLRAEVREGEVTYVIEPLSDYTSDAKPNEYVRYNVADIITTEDHICGTEESQLEVEIDETNIPDNLEDRAANCLKVEVMYTGDYDLYARFDYNFNNAASWMYWRVVNGGKRYYAYNGFSLNLIIKKGWLYTRNSNIATSGNATTFLTQWKNFANNNASWINRGDVNILFTGKNTGGSTVGAAWVRSICNSYYAGGAPYTFVEYQYSSYYSDITTAHEIGHILGADHSNYGFMASNVTNADNSMSDYTRNQLNNWVWNNDNCLGYWECQ